MKLLVLCFALWAVANASDLDALVAMTKGLNKPLPKNWDTTTPCTWQGITCDSTQTKVIGFLLTGPSISLDGTLDLTSFPANTVTFVMTNQPKVSVEKNNFTTLPPTLTSLTINNCPMVTGSFSTSRKSSLQTLDLSNNAIEVAPDFTQLPSTLTTLRLSNNGMSGALDLSTFSPYQNLMTIALDNNKFSGSLDFSTVTARTLDLHMNLLGGSIDFSTLPSALTYLDLGNNMFGGNINALQGAASSLVTLRLSNNNFTGPVNFTQLALAQNIGEISLDGNRFFGPIDFSPFRKGAVITTIKLGNNMLSGNVTLKDIPNSAVTVQLSNNTFSGSLDFSSLAELTRIGNLASLTLDHNRFSGSLDLSAVPGYLFLTLAYNDFCGGSAVGNANPDGSTFPCSVAKGNWTTLACGPGSGDATLEGCDSGPNVTRFNCQNQCPGGPTPAGISDIAALRIMIQNVDPNKPMPKNWGTGTDACSWDGVHCDPLSGNVTSMNLTNLTNPVRGFLVLTQLPQHLTTFTMSNQPYANIASMDLRSLPPSLTTVTITNCPKIAGAILLASNTSLTTLDLSNNAINNIGNIGTSLPSSLQILRLSNNPLNWAGFPVDAFVAATNLAEISFSGCGLSGYVGLNGLNIPTIDFSNNNLQGNLSFTELGQAVTTLDLSNNRFTGGIASIVQTTSYQILRLTNNYLSGTVNFTQIAAMNNLQELSLNGNKFSGTLNFGAFSSGSATGVPTTLNLQNNSFSGSVALTSIPNGITTLQLAMNKFSGTLTFSYLKELTNTGTLQTLTLDTNAFDGAVDLSGVPPTFSITLADNQFLRRHDVGFVRADVPNQRGAAVDLEGMHRGRGCEGYGVPLVGNAFRLPRVPNHGAKGK